MPSTNWWVRSYYPDFLFLREDNGSGKYVIVEAKADNQIDDAVVQAKKNFANQLAIASGMVYQIVKASDVMGSTQWIGGGCYSQMHKVDSFIRYWIIKI